MRLVKWIIKPFVDLWVLETHEVAYELREGESVKTCLKCGEDWPCTKATKVFGEGLARYMR